MPNPQEVATIRVQGHDFSNWESVRIELRWTEAYPIFSFTTADIYEQPGQMPPDNWTKLAFKPGDEAAIYLGTVLAIAGVITVRQTSYEPNNKGVMYQGVGVTWYAARSSVLHGTSNFDGKTFEQIAREVLGPTRVPPKVVGVLDATPFARCSNEQGETIWHFLERLARVRGAILGSDNEGNMLLIGNHKGIVTAEVAEGVNIIRCQATISMENIYSEYIIRGQTAASDVQSGIQSSEQEAWVGGSAKRYSPILTPAEQPVWSKAELDTRAKYEWTWHEGTIIQVTVVVQGWFRPSGGLWIPGDDVTFTSPMTTLVNMTLKINSVIFSQDRNEGTLTTLDLVAPWLLMDRGEFNVSNPAAPPTSDATPSPPTPPAVAPADPPPSTLEAPGP